MRLELFVGNEDPVIYPILETKILIGSAENAQIVLPVSAGISRKHLQITVENDKFFVTDLGSTNGTFINDERLVPGTPMEFTSFFPVRIAENVFLSLLSDAEESSSLSLDVPAPVPTVEKKTTAMIEESVKRGIEESLGKEEVENHSATRVININTLNKTNTKKKIAERIEVRAKKAPVKKKKSGSFGINNFIIIGLAGVGLSYWHLANEEKIAPQVEIVTRPKPVKNKKIIQELPTLVKESEIPQVNEIQAAFSEVKCATAVEKSLCEIIADSSSQTSGVVEKVDKIIILIPENKWYRASLENELKNRADNLKQRSEIIFLYFLKSLPQFNWKKFEKNIFIVFFREDGNRPTPATTVGIRFNALDKLVSILPANLEQELWETSKTTLPRYSKHFRVINETTAPEPLAVESAPLINATTTGTEQPQEL